MSLADLLNAWRTDSNIAANIAAWRTFPARPARVVPFPAGLHPALADALRARGINTLYTHQALAWQQAQAGRNLVIATGTASGKTLCYNLPVLDRLLRDPNARALYLFPTKALAQDQVQRLGQLLEQCVTGNFQPTLHGEVFVVEKRFFSYVSARPGGITPDNLNTNRSGVGARAASCGGRAEHICLC